MASNYRTGRREHDHVFGRQEIYLLFTRMTLRTRSSCPSTFSLRRRATGACVAFVIGMMDAVWFTSSNDASILRFHFRKEIMMKSNEHNS